MEIICECGHPAKEHDSIEAWEDNDCVQICCECKLTKNEVEARYWAREYKAKYDEFVAKWNDAHANIYDELNNARELTNAYKNLANYWKERYHAMRKDFDEMLGSMYEPKA